MIRNERQYRVTLAQRERLVNGLDAQPQADAPDWVKEAGRQAVASQILELDNELAEYAALRDSESQSATEVADISDLPRALIRARIAAHMTQRELADRLGLKEQQVQKYEATEYAGASVTRLQAIMLALGVSFRGEMTLPPEAGQAAKLRKQLRDRGLPNNMLSRRFFPAGAQAGTSDLLSASAKAARVFRIGQSGEDETQESLASAASFRAPVTANRDQISGYATYAEYLARLLVRSITSPYTPLPSLETLREQLASDLAEHPLQALLRTCWTHGIPVLPLSDPGMFHGACWWIDGRPAIALKHGMRSPDRWAFLLAHEMEHARSEPGVSVLEEDLPVREWREKPEERAADQQASALLMGGRAEAIAQVAVDTAHNEVARLKQVVPAVAAAGEVSVGILADYLAARLTSSGINWWPTANTLHPKDRDAWRSARNMLFSYVDFLKLDDLDREILIDGIGL